MAAEVSIEENEEAANVDEGDLSAYIEEIVQFIETEIADEAQQDEPNVDVPVEENDGRDDAIDDSDDDFIAHIDEDDNRSELELSDAEEYEDDFLSDYESDDHCEAANNSDEEFDNDPF
ncbi:PREDICTED: prostatic spermine-binding protein-like [Erythranthe guttata]|uniref:prostatic spermine-binding protein-like n=1 Tax=Erythranthe guttata TaxID=4155 RepID=UPI00064DFAB9|nr:PREDICTED: prostatic spermine-binding protein-like [Erythranthe guttata]|eukprot:XP_012836801.1 PREDICTED: prostatic spermine-binding protein-like [Erythranthe guttata]